MSVIMFFFFFSSRRRHTRSLRDWSSDVCSSDLATRDVEVLATDASRAVAVEKQTVSVARQSRGLFVGGRVDGGAQWPRCAPGIADTRSLRYQDVGAADVPGTIAALEVQAEPILGDGRPLVDEARVHDGAKVDRRRPVGEARRIGCLRRGQQGGRDRLGG